MVVEVTSDHCHEYYLTVGVFLFKMPFKDDKNLYVFHVQVTTSKASAPRTTRENQNPGNIFGMSLPSVCPGALTSRIVGGTEPRIGAYPWLALLGFTKNENGVPVWKCGGALIGYQHVLTAAHCVANLPGKYKM